MENDRKNMILKKISEDTRESISNGTLSFEQCNALNVALDLKMDRSNVSRILNQLFNELHLIKINGRPTTFIAREILVSEFPYAKIPQVLPNLSTLQEYLRATPSIEYKSPVKDFDIIGNLPRETLKDTVDKLLPVFLYPQKDPLLFILIGEKGCGKKHFCEQLYYYGIDKALFSPDNSVFTCNYREILTDRLWFLHKIVPGQTAMILIEVNSELDSGTVYTLKKDITNLYRNASCQSPVIFLLFDKEVLNIKELSSLTPCIIHFPSLEERTPMEKIKLILSFVQEAADYNNLQIHMGSDVVISLLCSNYQYNIFELKNEIQYALAHSIYLSKTGPVQLTLEAFSENIMRPRHKKDNLFREASLIVEQVMPPFIDFYPQTACAVLDYLTNSQISSLTSLKPRSFLQELARRDVLNADTSLEIPAITEEQTQLYRLQYLLKPAIAKTSLHFDSALFRRLLLILDSMLRGSFYIENAPLQTDFTCSPTAQELTDTVISRLEIQFSKDLSTEHKAYIQAFVHYALQYLENSSIVYVLISHQAQTACNYAQYMNFISESRCCVTLGCSEEDERNFDRYVKKVVHIFRQLNTGKEYFVLTDRPSLSSLAKHITASVNLVVLSFYPLTLTVLNRIYSINKAQSIHAVSMFRKLLDSKKQDRSELERVITKYPDSYILSVLGTQFDSFFELSNTILINKLLFDILKDICSKLGLLTETRLVLEFLFHGNFMISRSIQKLPVCCQPSETLISQYHEVYDLIEKKLLLPRELSSLNISHDEIYIMFHIIMEYLLQ